MFKKLFLFNFFLVISGCLENKVNSTANKIYFDRKIQNYIEQSSCLNNPTKKSKIYYQIQDTKAKFLMSPQDYSLDENIFDYDYKSPLRIDEKKLEEDLKKFESGDKSYSKILKLSSLAERYEFLKCSQGQLEQKKIKDIRPFLLISDDCKKNGDVICDEKALNQLISQNKLVYKDSIERMCQAFFNDFHCAAEKELSIDNKQLSKLTLQYLNWVKNERYDPLFKLKDKSRVFYCKKNEKVVLPLKITFSIDDPYLNNALAEAIAQMWKNEKFEIKIDQFSKNELNIVYIDSGISHVIDTNHYTIFLEKNLNFEEKKRVVAHEFGHIIGFPDCYVEFYDNKTSEIIYYELNDMKNNIMCANKIISKVPDNYFEQMIQKSCKF